MQENYMSNIYKNYFSNANYTVTRKDFFTDSDGYPNKVAFENFASSLYEDEAEPDERKTYYLVCLNINLRKSNQYSYAMGNYVLRKFVIDIQTLFVDTYIFRIQGEKFNIFVIDSEYVKLKKFLDEPSESYEIYYGCIKEKYTYTRNHELIQKNIALMYQNKNEKKTETKLKNRMIVGNKESTPPELQETLIKKYTCTMWRTVIKVSIIKPIIKDFTVYVYPTRFLPKMQSVPLVMVIDELISYRAEYGTNIIFGVNGVIFMLNARFDREGHLNTAIYATDDGVDADCKFDIKTTEGKYLPANFGKRLDKGRELYPIKRNIQGFYDYVILSPENIKNAVDNKENKLEVNTTGIVSVNEKRYGVFVDNESLDLLPQ